MICTSNQCTCKINQTFNWFNQEKFYNNLKRIYQRFRINKHIHEKYLFRDLETKTVSPTKNINGNEINMKDVLSSNVVYRFDKSSFEILLF